MTQDEIAVMEGGRCILQVRGVRPFFSDKFDITKHSKYKYLFNADKKNAFDMEVFFSSNYFAMIEDGGSSSALIIAALFIVIACGIVIYSLFYISVVGKTKEYGRLKVLGTTPRQIKRIVRKESYPLSLVSIPIGLIIGSMTAFALMPGYWNWIVNVPYMAGIIIITEVMILVSTHAPVKLAGKVSAIEAVRITAVSADDQKSVSKTLHRKITPAGLARMNFVRHRRKTLLTMVSLGFTGVLLMCIASYSNSIDYISMARQSFPNGEYELSLNGDAAPEDMAVLQSPVMEIFLFFTALLLLQAAFSMTAVRYSKQRSLVERIKIMD